MSKKKYTHLFFDLDYTLWDFETNSFHALHIAFLHFGIEKQCADYDHFFEVFTNHNNLLWNDYRSQQVTKNELKRLRFEKTFDELRIKGVDAMEINELYLNEIPKQKALIEGAAGLLEYLQSKGYLMFIITNGFREVQHIKIENSGLKRYFKKVFISEDVKTPKPGYKIFEYAVKSSNARKINSLMVGDDWEVDVKGAVDFGIDAVYLSPDGKSLWQDKNLKDPVRNAIYCVNELHELKDML